jgi:hypothetical protein
LSAPPTIDIQAQGGWIRWLPGGVPSGGYVTLMNAGSIPHVLTGASSPDFGEVSLHQSRESHGMSTMVAIASITIAPHTSVSFSPGGYHIMLMRPTHTLHPGDKVSLNLRFAGGPTLNVPFEVRAAGAGDNESASMPAMPGMQK